MEDLKSAIERYESQLSMVRSVLENTQDDNEKESLLALQKELAELIKLTKESLEVYNSEPTTSTENGSSTNENSNEVDEEYALFMKEMAETGAYDDGSQNADTKQENEGDDSDIEDELASLLGMKCAVYHTHAWGGQPSLHNAMVSSVEPHQDDDQFSDLQVRVLYTHPTHTEMLPCPYYLNGECKFTDDQCRYSHGNVVKLSDLKEAIDPDYDGVKVGSGVLLKLKPPEDEDMTIAKKSTEKYHLWHRAVVKDVDLEKRTCIVKMEQNMKVGDKRKSTSEEYHVKFEEMFPLNNDGDSSDSEDRLSDTEYPDSKCAKAEDSQTLLIDKSLQNDVPAMGEWERHTRGMGSKLMLAMGYVPGTGLGAASDGRLRPVQATVLPKGATLDQALAMRQNDSQVEQKLKKIQKREEERNKRAYEREKEKEKRNVFNVINKALGDQTQAEPSRAPSIDVKQSTSKDLNIEQFKIAEDCRKIEADIVKLKHSLVKYPSGTGGHRSITTQITEKNKELGLLKNKEQQIAKEQKHRKDKQKMTVF
ncbi:zinc finger CCCH-type with G patch domain-containing protein [Aricia agestis]|uniref:zinc finger CCCH-type with G patch domain-containing protein n=1 Tax=Aricia agestis TaxID=91739 RepID=UPI001C2076D0|nr:zinc finger CCCH-type with G patch domain-containing protein [Aricia agestis]